MKREDLFRQWINAEVAEGLTRKISVPADVLPNVRKWAGKKQEHFLLVTLNGAHEVIRVRSVTVGIVNRCMIHPGELFKPAIQDQSAAVIIAHNHPSGDVTPSMEDNEVTRRMIEAGEVLGITVVDHLVFGRRGYYSYLEHDKV